MVHDAKATATPQHAAILVQALAEQTCRPLDEAQRAYDAQFARLDKEARVKHFLPVLAARHARSLLSGRKR
jgi:hypothetical protein